jgi:hypothetical protein
MTRILKGGINMKILYILQQSVYNNEGKWLTGDSNIQMMRGIIGELLEKTDWTFDIIIAPLKDFADIKSFDMLLKSERVRWIERETAVNAFTNRYNFDVEWFTNVLVYDCEPGYYDIVWNNIIELSRNIKTILWANKLKAKLISCNYWIDCPTIGEAKIDTSISYDFRQIDGAECSDLVPFTCESTREAFINNAVVRGNILTAYAIKEKSTIWDFGFSQKELDTYYTSLKFPKKTIVFPNRLSGINYTHHEEFIIAVNDLYRERQDFQVMFCNPSQKYSWEWLMGNVKPFYLYSSSPLSREAYITLLWRSHIVMSLYTIERYGGCSNVEAIYCGCIPIMPKFGEYGKRAPKDYLFVKSDLSNLKTVINVYLNILKTDEIQKEWLHMRQHVLQHSAYEQVGQRVIDDILNLFK